MKHVRSTIWQLSSGSFLVSVLLLLPPLLASGSELVAFPSGNLTLRGVLYKPEGTGPFPAIVYNHGSAPGMLSSEAFEALGPVFSSRGWVFFGPYRRGQGLSASAGPFIGDQIAAAQKQGGVRAGAAAMVRLLETDHYPAFGKSAADGHSFGYFGSAVWADDVFRFLERHCHT